MVVSFRPRARASTMNDEGREVHYELYRRSTLGMTLTDALDEMVTNGELTPSLAMKVLAQFDKVRVRVKGLGFRG